MHKLNIIIPAIALILVIIAIAPNNQMPDQDIPEMEQEETSVPVEKAPSANEKEDRHVDTSKPILSSQEQKNTESSKKLIMIHNGQGSMCVNQLEFLESIKLQYPSLIIEEHLTTDPGTTETLRQLKTDYTASEGISKTYGYLPITFINNHAYSGFNREVKERLQSDIHEICAS